jgi:hypothetical protein
MSNSYIPVKLRREVVKRAGGCCEYCRTNSEAHSINFAIDHVIAEKHGGETKSDNLCYSCFWCNSYKGSDLSSVDWESGKKIVVTLFNPREQIWDEHFRLEDLEILALTSHGRVTINLLQMNATERLEERKILIESGLYPCINSAS